jgi:hypothetical protein
VQAGGGSPANALTSEARENPLRQAGASIDLVDQRLRSMGVGAVGDDDRDPAQEAGDAEEAAELDDPPLPPGGG